MGFVVQWVWERRAYRCDRCGGAQRRVACKTSAEHVQSAWFLLGQEPSAPRRPPKGEVRVQPLSRAGSGRHESLGAFAAAAVGRPCPCSAARSSPKRAEFLDPESAALGICSRAGAESPDARVPSRSLEWAPTEPRGGIGAARPASLLGARRVRTPGSVQGFRQAPSALPESRAEEPRIRPPVWPRSEGGEAGRSGSSGHQRPPSKDVQRDAAF